MLGPHLTPCNSGNPGLRPPHYLESLSGEGGGLLNKCLYGEVPARSPSPYPFIYYLACEQAKCKPARRAKGKGNPFLAFFFFSPFPHTESPFTGYKLFFYEKSTPSVYLLLMNGHSFTSLLLALWTISQTQMADFPPFRIL